LLLLVAVNLILNCHQGGVRLMLLVDTSIWIDHLRQGDSLLSEALGKGMVVVHDWVIGELACGQLRNRDTVLTLLQDLPHAPLATHHEVLTLIHSEDLMGQGVGYIDVHLLASCRLGSLQLWTRDRRLQRLANDLAIASTLP